MKSKRHCQKDQKGVVSIFLLWLISIVKKGGFTVLAAFNQLFVATSDVITSDSLFSHPSSHTDHTSWFLSRFLSIKRPTRLFDDEEDQDQDEPHFLSMRKTKTKTKTNRTFWRWRRWTNLCCGAGSPIPRSAVQNLLRCNGYDILSCIYFMMLKWCMWCLYAALAPVLPTTWLFLGGKVGRP